MGTSGNPYNGSVRKLFTESGAKCFSHVTTASRLTLLSSEKEQWNKFHSSLFVNTVGISCAMKRHNTRRASL